MVQGFGQRLRAAGLIGVTLAMLAACAILISLGNWQMNRKAWKEGLVADIAARTRAAPADAGARILDGLPEYTRVRLHGRFLHHHERFMFADGPGGSGFHVLTPLEIAPGQVVWVNRGYIPARVKDPAARATGQIEGTAEVTALVRLPGGRNAFTPSNDVAKNVWFWRDLDALNASIATAGVTSAPWLVDAEALPANPGGWPQGGTTLVTLSNRHLEYALTWYALAVTLIGVYLAFARSLRVVRPGTGQE